MRSAVYLMGVVLVLGVGMAVPPRAEEASAAEVPSIRTSDLWTEGFEGGLAGAKPYHKAAPQSLLEEVSGDAAEGERFIRATLPGQRALEGLSITATNLDGGRLARVTARVRGRGAIWLCLNSANGWLYSPTQLPLTDDWQPIQLNKVLRRQDRTLGVYFISKTAQPGAVFEVDAIRVEMSEEPRVYDAAVKARRFEAEDYAANAEHVTDEPTASGGAAVEDLNYVTLSALPFPRTSRPVTVAVRLRFYAEEGQLRLLTALGDNKQTLSAVPIQPADEWQWVQFPPACSGEVGDALHVQLRCKNAKTRPSALDALVLGTAEGLPPEALDSAHEVFSGFPLVSVSRCATPPLLDAKGDDACWANTVACPGFAVVRSNAAPEGATTARLCYDDENLYALFECEEPTLDVRRQRTHEFHAKATEQDHAVTKDDCCVLVLEPARDGEGAFDIFVNALGTIEDARCSAPDLWTSRDLEWDSGARAVGHIGDGAYTLEIAIPFAGLTDRTPAPGERWNACIGRVARTRRETSAWNPCGAGFHDPDPWGTLLFAGAGPGLLLTPPTTLEPGPNKLTAQITQMADGAAHGVLLTSRVGSPEAWDRTVQFVDAVDFVGAADKTTDATLSFQAPEDGETLVAYGALDAATLEPLYLSPVAARSVHSATAIVRLACDGPYELYVNDEVVGHGEATDGDELPLSLRKGPNVIALKLERGTAAIDLEPPGWQPDRPIRWKLAPPDTPNASATSIDDGGWSVAEPLGEPTGEHPTLGPIIGRPGGEAVLRHTLLWQQTRVWPTPSPALHVARGAVQHVTIMAEGLPRRRLRDWAVCLAVPEEFEVLGSTGYYGTKIDTKPCWVCTDLGVQEVDGERMRVARIAADKAVTTQGGHAILKLFNVFVRCPEETGSADEAERRFVFWADGNGGALTEPPQSVPVRLVPALRGRQPKHMTWQLWGSFFNAMDDFSMREATLQLCQAAGINDLVAGDAWTSDHAPTYGLHHTACINFEPWSLGMGPYLEAHPDKRRVDAGGEFDDAYACMTALLDESWEAVVAKLQAKIERDHPDTLDYDYEYPPFGRPHACFCSRCLAAFREHAQLPADLELNPDIVRNEYEARWVDFMAWRAAILFRKLKDEVRRLAPGTEFSLYSGYQSEQNPFQYGVDWRYVGDLDACDIIGCGYGRPPERIAATLKAANGIPAVFGALHHPYDPTDTTPSLPFTKARLLRRALDASGGVLLYHRLPLDGRSWRAIAETTRLAAAYEDVFLQGRRTALPGLDESEVQVVTHGPVTLICVMNRGREPRSWTIPLPTDKGAGREYYSGSTIAAGEMATCELPPGETAVYVLGE